MALLFVYTLKQTSQEARICHELCLHDHYKYSLSVINIYTYIFRLLNRAMDAMRVISLKHNMLNERYCDVRVCDVYTKLYTLIHSSIHFHNILESIFTNQRAAMPHAFVIPLRKNQIYF